MREMGWKDTVWRDRGTNWLGLSLGSAVLNCIMMIDCVIGVFEG